MHNISDVKGSLGEFFPKSESIEWHEPHKGNNIVLYVLVAMLLSSVIWASISKLDKIVVGSGRLVTPVANFIVQPLESGILKSIDVKIGQIVERGTVLATLDATFTNADSGQLKSRRETLSLQADRLQSELDGKNLRKPLDAAKVGQADLQAKLTIERKLAFDARMKQFEESIQRLYASRETNRNDQRVLGQRMKSLEELESMVGKLESQQFVSRARLLEAEEKRLEVQRDFQLAVNKEREIDREISTIEAERSTFSRTWRQDAFEKLSATVQQREEVNEQLTKATLRSNLVTLAAPERAVVLEVGKKSVGSVVREAEPLFTLVPIDSELEFELEVAPLDISAIRAGDIARIKIDAYPFQKHGVLEGTISTISADAFTRQRPTGDQSFYYIVRIKITRKTLDNAPSGSLYLLPGMTGSGEIISGKRSVISYFLYPIVRVFDESLRER